MWWNQARQEKKIDFPGFFLFFPPTWKFSSLGFFSFLLWHISKIEIVESVRDISDADLKISLFLPENILCKENIYQINDHFIKIDSFLSLFPFSSSDVKTWWSFFPPTKRKSCFFCFFFLPTHPKNPCRDPLTKEYTECRLSIQSFSYFENCFSRIRQ